MSHQELMRCIRTSNEGVERPPQQMYLFREGNCSCGRTNEWLYFTAGSRYLCTVCIDDQREADIELIGIG